MNWIEACVSTTGPAADAVSDLLMRHGAKGSQIIDRDDVPSGEGSLRYGALYGEELRDQMPEDVQVKAWFASREDLDLALLGLEKLPGQLGFDPGSLAVLVTQVQEEDWAENWKKYYKPFRVGRRLVVQPVWEDYSAQEDDLLILMDPGMAFGTGSHETTRLCLALMEKHAKGGRGLDIGTGSGILSIALARLGCNEVLGVDLDPVAVSSARQNVQRNGLEQAITIKEGDLAGKVSGSYDFIVANILADIVIDLAGQVGGILAKDGLFLCSGIIRDREADVQQALDKLGFTLADRLNEGEWVALLFKAAHA